MFIDFKEIPAGNAKGEELDQFELFSRDFLEKMKFKILQHPSRGADGKKDMIVKGSFNNEKEIMWLVSCKHNAHSGKSVKDTDEINIKERLKQHNCQGFLGMYSTLAATSLSNLLYGNNDIKSEILDHRRIESYIVNQHNLREVMFRYFTESFEKHKNLLYQKQTPMVITPKKRTATKKKTISRTKKQPQNILTEEDMLRISKTAMIILEVDKIKEKFFGAEWKERGVIITELYKYYEHTNTTIADHVYDFLSGIAYQTRSGMTEDIAISVYSLTIDFFPYSQDEKDKKKIIELGTQCANIGFSMVYDAAIKIKNYHIMMYGLTILKYIYKKGKQEGMTELATKVDDVYKNLESTLKRPERTDLGEAQELVKLFKADRKEGTLTFPPLNDNLLKVIYQE